MIESNLPRWSVRLDTTRPQNSSNFADLLPIVSQHYHVAVAMDQFLGPYNARQRNSDLPYRAPDRDTIKQIVRQGGMNDFSYSAYVNNTIAFCEIHKGQRALPAPHPSVIHSIQLPLGAFELESNNGETLVRIAGAKLPLVVKGLRDLNTVKFIIVRPKLGQLGTASSKNWEILFFRQALGYIPEWVDSNLNPKFSGVF